jgi:hypothetical protein
VTQKAWDESSVRDLERRGGSTLGLGLSGHHEADQAAEAEAGNGRPGVLVQLTVKQVTVVLGIAVTLASGAVVVWTREPKPEAAHASAATPVPQSRIEDLSRQIQERADDIDGMRAEVRDTREQVREMRGDVREMQASIRAIERLLAKGDRQSAGGGSR